MKIRVGLTTKHAGWERLVSQEAMPHAVVSNAEELDPSEFSVVIDSGSEGKRWADAIKDYVARGGSLLTTVRQYCVMFGGSARRTRIRYLFPRDNDPGELGLIDLASSGHLLPEADFMATDSAASAIGVRAFGQGVVAALPVDLGKMVLDTRTTWKAFHSRTRRLPMELVSLVTKGELRKLFRVFLELLHHRRGLPYCHLWYFPDGVSNVFILRIDTDFGTAKEIEGLYDLAVRSGIKMSWYLHTQSHEGWLARFGSMLGHEIGVHCYEHALLKSYASARVDIFRALDLLGSHGIKPVGIAAPYGQMTPAFARVAAEFGFLYSSEFSFDYDNVPSFPLFARGQSNVLQIPIHPICVGSFRGCDATETDIADYFVSVIRRKLQVQEPVILYHHPNDGHHSVLEQVIQSVKVGSKNLLMRDVAHWWSERSLASYRLEFSGDQIRVAGEASPTVYFHVTRDGHEAVVPFQRRIELDRIPWMRKKGVDPLPPDIVRSRAFSLRRLHTAVQVRLRRRRK